MPQPTTSDERSSSATAGSGDPTSGGHVGALDGMRALAVLLVLLFHLRVPGFSSGYLGVDIFFVLSGFLITTLLLTELHRTGRISLPDFWARRARRLLPALVLLLIVVAVVTWRTGTFTERTSVRGDLLATTGYVANWHFIDTSSYFADIGVDSPLEHTWSLAIEEQFYLLWPLVVFGIAAAAGRRFRLSVGAFAAIGAVVSVMLLSWLWEPGSVERAYMGTDAKIFEPMIGAAGAAIVASPWGRRQLQRAGPALLVLGIVSLIVGIVLIDALPSSYYRGGAVIVALATLLIVAPLWVGRGRKLSGALSWGPIAWIGVVSYGAYLWHWPLTVWLGARDATGTDRLLRQVAVIGLTFAVAGLSYHLIEHPIRRGRWPARKAGGSRSARVFQRRVTIAAIPVALLTVACISVAATQVPKVSSKSHALLLVGDSVPMHLSVAMDEVMTARGWRLLAATHGACPVTAEVPARPDGRAMDKADRCSPEIIREQDKVIRETDPDVVIWWDRWSLANFLTPSGEFVRSDSPRFWQLRRDGLRRAVARLGSRGATVVLVATEPVGRAVGITRCVDEHCHWWVRYQIDHYEDVTTRWNDILRRFAEGHSKHVRFLSVTDAICAKVVSPCDDRIDGVSARPDGTHYQGAGQDLVIRTLLRLLGPLVAPASDGTS